MEDEAIIEWLIEVRGIGRWTVEMMLMFHLGRPDVLLVGDLGVRKGIAATYGLEEVPEGDALEVYGGSGVRIEVSAVGICGEC
jgi:DNA-3-methyladenine glycosylase II